jgi:hypothetical protein
MRFAAYSSVYYRFRQLAGLAGMLYGSLLSPDAHAQTPAWQSVIASGGSGTAYARASAASPDGAVYVLGDFYDTIQLGALTLHSTKESQDVFVARWNPVTSQFVWAQCLGGPGNEDAVAMAVQDNHLYLTGTFLSDTLRFGNQVLINAAARSGRFHNDGTTEVFVARLTDLGSSAATDWALATSGVEDETVAALAVAGQDIYLTGTHQGASVSIGNQPIAPGRDSANYGPAFLARIRDDSRAGKVLWAQQLGSAGLEVKALAARGDAVYLAGTFSELDQQPTNLDTFSKAGSGGFVARLHAHDSYAEWIKWLPDYNASFTKLNAMALRGNNLYLAGAARGDTLRLDNLTVAPAHGAVFVAKLADEGPTAHFRWVRAFEGSADDEPTAIAASGSEVYVAGYFFGRQFALGAHGPVLHRRSRPSTNAIFVVRLSDEGDTARVAWATRAGIVGWHQTRPYRIHGHVYRWHRLGLTAAPVALVLPGSRLYLLGETNAALRFGQLRLRRPRGKRWVWHHHLFLARLRDN